MGWFKRKSSARQAGRNGLQHEDLLAEKDASQYKAQFEASLKQHRLDDAPSMSMALRAMAKALEETMHILEKPLMVHTLQKSSAAARYVIDCMLRWGLPIARPLLSWFLWTASRGGGFPLPPPKPTGSGENEVEQQTPEEAIKHALWLLKVERPDSSESEDEPEKFEHEIDDKQRCALFDQLSIRLFNPANPPQLPPVFDQDGDGKEDVVVDDDDDDDDAGDDDDDAGDNDDKQKTSSSFWSKEAKFPPPPGWEGLENEIVTVDFGIDVKMKMGAQRIIIAARANHPCLPDLGEIEVKRLVLRAHMRGWWHVKQGILKIAFVKDEKPTLRWDIELKTFCCHLPDSLEDRLPNKVAMWLMRKKWTLKNPLTIDLRKPPEERVEAARKRMPPAQ